MKNVFIIAGIFALAVSFAPLEALAQGRGAGDGGGMGASHGSEMRGLIAPQQPEFTVRRDALLRARAAPTQMLFVFPVSARGWLGKPLQVLTASANSTVTPRAGGMGMCARKQVAEQGAISRRRMSAFTN